MKKFQIKELAGAIVKHGGISDEMLNRILHRFSRQDLKNFVRFLSDAVKSSKVFVSFAGNLKSESESKISAMFPNKDIVYKKDDENLAGGMVFEYGDFILDCSVSGTIKRILSNMRDKI
jgi:F0F1-type ATP synthase delta subunit